MKKVIVAVILTAISSTGLLANSETNISRRVLTSFTQEYKDVSDISWKQRGSYVLASFLLNNKRVEVFYDYSGDKIGSQTYFNVENFSTSIKRKLATRYSDYVIRESIEFNAANETAYFLCAENDEKKVYLKIVNGGIEVMKVVKK